MDKFWERYIQSRPAPGSSKGAFDAFAAAHKEPRIMAQNGLLVGTPTKEVTQYGKRIFETPEGNVSEKSTTFFLNGQWMNVPSIHEGRAFTDDQLRRMIKEGTIQPTSVHGSRIEAEEAAASRSNMMKSHTRGFEDGGRIGFYKGKSVVKSHGQKLIKLTEAGESSVSIAKKLGLKQQTVSNALNAIDKGIAGDEYKLSKPLKNLQIPKNQYTGKLLTENKELIKKIKKDAPTMSDKEIKAKHKVKKGVLKKIKDKHNIKTRSSYLPEGTQKESKPYADRYTAEEKSEMYKARKGRETEEDRKKARARDQKYRDKIYKEYKMEPSSRSVYDDLWKDIARSSKEGDRIKLIEGPKYASGANYDDFKSRRFLDTKTGVEFGYNDLEKYLDSGKLKNVTYESVSNPYKLKWQINKSGLREEIQKAYFGEKYQPPKMFRAQNTFHVHHVAGVGVDPFTTQLTFADQNLGLVHNKKFNKEWAKLIERNAPLSERKNYLKFVKSKIGPNIAQTLEFPEVGKTRTYGEIGTDMQKLLSDEKLKKVKGLEVLSNFWCGKKQSAAGGGRIGFSGSCPVEVKQKNFLRMTNDVANGKITGEAAEQIAKNAGKVVAKAGSKSALMSILGPAGIGLDIAFEVGSIGLDVAGGKSLNRALQDNWITGAFIPGTGQEEFHKELYAKDSKAKPYGQALDLIVEYNNAQKRIDFVKQSNYRARGLKEQALAVAERDLKGIEASYNALTKQGKIMEEGSNEYENYMAAKTEFEDAAKAKSYFAEADLQFALDPPTSDRAVSYQREEPVKIDFKLPPNYTTFKADLPTREEIIKYGKEKGYEVSPNIADEIITGEKWRQEFEQPGIRGTQDWRGAGGGMVGIRKPSAIPPESGPQSQGLASLKKYGSYY